ncbi:MAG: tetratricopeptide repeat protein [Methylococcales bacterium]|nr:tetratricopeptide repeat protein [Methylococcales bacterium]MDD5631844.1 tetratricopeptide repeat protein [Methylococcales bacterium]
MSFLSELWNTLKKISLAAALIGVIGLGGWMAYIYDLSKKPQLTARQLIVEGDNALNIGRYADAERIFEAEFKANPQNKQAAWGLKIARIRQTFDQPAFKEAIEALYQEAPDDANVNLFLGEFYTANNEPDKAVQHYEQAIRQNPKLAEAHNDLANYYEKQGYHEAAKVESLSAIDIAPIPKYRNNLGALYFKQNHYEEAIKEYGRNKEYPLSALESAKLYWRLEYLSQALSYQNQAIEWLEDKSIMSKPDNQEPWSFKIGSGKEIELVTVDEKKCYAYYGLSVSFYLQGDLKGAEDEVQKIRDLKVARQADIQALLAADLNGLAQANSDFSAQIAAYKQLYL